MVVSSGTISSAQAQAIRKWKFLFDRTYQADASAFSGWISSYTGDPIPLAEMEAWLDATIERILACRPTAVLELGCGTGLIARRVAPHVALYAGVDISAAAIEQLTASIGDVPGARFLCAAAHEASSLFDGDFDLVILNSVIQYFTDLDYLEEVLADAIALLRPGGSLFIGDVRNADLAEVFFASVALAQARDDATPEALRDKALALSDINRELQLSPTYILRLQERFPRISDARVLLKSGCADNELTRFRYDLVLTLDTRPAHRDVDMARWTDLQDLESRLRAAPDRALRLTQIGNARLTSSLIAQRLIAAEAPPPTAGRIRRAAEEADGDSESPDRFETLRRRYGFDVALLWNADDRAAFDVLFTPASV